MKREDVHVTYDVGTIRAEAKDGVITVHVPKSKAEAKKPTEIKIQ